MGAKLRVKPSDEEGYEVEIANTVTIGRTRDNMVSFATSQHVSRQHAIIRCHNAYQYQIMDLGSRNGTFVNGRRVIMPVTLEHGASIRLAGNEIIFEQTEDGQGEHAVEATLAAGTDTDMKEVATVALMVCDIRGFSTMSEVLPEDQVARLLGEWFRDAGNNVQETGGVVDKFLGDAVLAYWFAHESARHAAESALRTGNALLEFAAKRRWPDPTKPFKIAVALHFGQVTCGNIGLVAQRDATIIGDTVNTVFRIESVMKDLNRELVMSRDFITALGEGTDGWTSLGEHQLKGKNQLVGLYSA